MLKYIFALLAAFSFASCSVSGDRRVDNMLDSMGLEVINDIPASDPTMAGKHIDSTIHMKPLSFYPEKQQYLIVLLHEICHHIGSLTGRTSYKLYKQAPYRLLEELIANKYAIAMMKRLGYKLHFSYKELNAEYMGTLAGYGYTKERVNSYVNAELKRSLEFSKKFLRRK